MRTQLIGLGRVEDWVIASDINKVEAVRARREPHGGLVTKKRGKIAAAAATAAPVSGGDREARRRGEEGGTSTRGQERMGMNGTTADQNMSREKCCVFCEIVRTGKTSDGSKILHEDDICIAIQDIAPAAYHHFLVIPKEHIGTTADLNPRHRNLVQHMHNVGCKLAKETRPDTQWKFGYHQPPFNSVNHLHMHCLAPPYKSILHSLKYKSLPWFITADSLLKRFIPA